MDHIWKFLTLPPLMSPLKDVALVNKYGVPLSFVGCQISTNPP